MNFLLTNDDSYNSLGIKAMIDVVKDFGNVYVAAPKTEYSQGGHQINYITPINVELKSKNFAIVDASPASCVRLAMGSITEKNNGVSSLFEGVDKFDMVLSGINIGSNLGIDLFVSGTVAAAREGALMGCPSIAFSSFYNDSPKEIDWDLTKKMFVETFTKILKNKDHFHKTLKERKIRGYYNVNFPINKDKEMPDIKIVPPAKDSFKLDFEIMHKDGNSFVYSDKSDYKSRIISEGGDIESCVTHKNITISEIEIFPC